MQQILNINSHAVADYANKLAMMHRSALPVAIRQTLTGAAADVKTNTMPNEAGRFVKRAPTFFSSQSKFEQAKGFNVNAMRAVVGFVKSNNALKEKGGATEDLEQQDDGGAIGHRAFVPLDKARAGGSYQRRVKADLTLTAIHARQSVATRSSIVDANKAPMKRLKGGRIRGNAQGQKWIKSAIAAGQGGFVIGTGKNSKGNRMLYRINGIGRKDGNTVINSTAIYSVKGGRSAHIKPTHFMRTASAQSARKMDQLFIINAEKQFRKYGII